MTNIEVGIEGIATAATIAVLALLYLGMWTRIARDAYRQDLFAIRDQLWDYAYRRRLLDTPAHRRLRDLGNTLIRSARSAHPVTFIMGAVCLKGDGPQEPTGAIVNGVPDPQDREYFTSMHNKMMWRLLRYLFVDSAFGLALLCVVGPIAVLTAVAWVGCKRLHRAGSTTVKLSIQMAKGHLTSRVEAGAYNLGRYEVDRKSCGKDESIAVTA
jgi:hypothetical protein